MNPINYLFIIIIFFIGIKTSISDFKIYKIKNKDILYGSLLGVLIYLTLFLIQLTTSQNLITLNYFKQLLVNLIFSIVIGIGFWLIKFWSAADAKLFILFSFLIPINIYQNGGIPIFFSFIIIINTFILLGIYSIFNIIKNRKNLNLKFNDLFKIKNIFKFEIFGSFIIIHWILKIILSSLPQNLFIIFSSLIFLFTKPLFSLFQKNKYFLLILILIRMILDKTIYSFDFIFEFIFIVIIFIIISTLMQLIEKIFTKKINIKYLKQGMILKYPIVKKNNKYYQLTKNSIEKLFKKQTNKNITSTLQIYIPKETRGINSQEFKKIKLIFKNKLIKENLIIKEHTSFAIYLFLGTIITLICKGSLVYWIIKLFNL